MHYNGVTADVVRYIKETYGCAPDFLWAKTPNNAAFRHSGNKKWFGALLLDMPARILGLSGEGHVDILDLKCPPVMIGSLIDGKRYLPGYHMNKEHWITLVLDGSIPMGEVYSMIDLSYDLTKPK